MRALLTWVTWLALLLAAAPGARAGVHGVAHAGTDFRGSVQMVAEPHGSADAGPGWVGALHGLLAQPDMDVSLLIVGLLLIYVELNVPGVVLPGAVGLLCVLLGVYGLWAFPLSPSAALFLLVGVMLFPLEAKLGGHGGLAALGTALLVYGLAHLVIGTARTPGVHLGTALAAGVSFGVITAVLGIAAAKARRSKRLMGEQTLIGARAVARTELAPVGQVELRGELWQARMEGGGSVPAGTEVEVRSREDLLLVVGAKAGAGRVSE